MPFSALVDELLAEYLRLSPVDATTLGNHDHDGEWPDLTDAGRRERVAFCRSALGRLGELDPASLTRDEAIDLRILREQLEADLWAETELREDAWNPMSCVYLLGGGLFALLSRDFAPLGRRLASAAQRMRGVPAVLEAARAGLTAPRADRGGAARPVSRFHLETAIRMLPGVADLARTAAGQAEALDDEELRDAVQDASKVAAAAVEASEAWMRDELLPVADGDFRLGAELYGEKFRHALRSGQTPEELEQRAASAFAQVRGEMVRLARELWPEWIGDEPMPADDGPLVRRVLDAIAAEHAAGDEMLDFCRAERDRIEAFIRERDLIGLANEPLQIIWTPPFLRAHAGAMLIPPGPLDRGLDSFFAITPMPDDWTDAQRESYLREENSRQLRLLTIHEAVPGHYLQLAYSNRTDSLVRAAFQSGVFAEGWAVYVTQVMMDVGYGGDDPALMLVHWKFYLRAIVNTLMDVGIHAGRMDEDDAMRLMVEGGFQEESEAVKKWERARLSSTQLCEYFLGSVEMTDLEREARRRTDAVGRPFVWRPFLESVLAHGTPSTPVIRDILFGD